NAPSLPRRLDKAESRLPYTSVFDTDSAVQSGIQAEGLSAWAPLLQSFVVVRLSPHLSPLALELNSASLLCTYALDGQTIHQPSTPRLSFPCTSPPPDRRLPRRRPDRE